MGNFPTFVGDIVSIGIQLGAIRTHYWMPMENDKAIRYHVTINGMDAVVEVEPARNGLQKLNWAVLPKSMDVKFPMFAECNSWPGQAWGSAIINRQIGFSINPNVRLHCKPAIRDQFRAALLVEAGP